MATLGDLERATLEALWAASKPMTAGDLREGLNAAPGRDLAQTTVLTVLSRLEAKRFVRRDRAVRPHRYTAAKTQDEYVAELMHEALGDATDRQAALARFIGSAEPDEAAAMRRLLGG